MKDLEAVKNFYSQKLGLEVTEINEGLQIHLQGAGTVFVYVTDHAVPSQHTIINFLVDDIDSTVEQLIAQGISMESYEELGMTHDQKGIVRSDSGPRAVAWFKDPAGYTLSLIQEK